MEYNQLNYRFADGTAMLNHFFIRLAFMDWWIKLLPADRVGQIINTIELRLNEQSMQTGGTKLSIPLVMVNAVKQ